MTDRIYKTAQKQLNVANINLNSIEKKPFNLSIRSNIKNMLPPIQAPQAKRVANDSNQKLIKSSRNKQSNKKGNRKNEQQQQKNRENKNQASKNGNKQRDKTLFNSDKKKQQSQIRQITNWVINTRDSKDIISLRNYVKSAFILSYIYNQFDKVQSKEFAKFKIYNDWELLQIQQNYADTNLGDFVIKMVNPDNLPKQYKKSTKINENSTISLTQAIQRYDSMFNTQQFLDKQFQQCEKTSFSISFYLLNFKPKRAYKSLQKERQDEDKDEALQFLQIFQYFIIIRPLNYSQYIALKKDEQFKQKQRDLMNIFPTFQNQQIKSKGNDNKKKVKIEKFFHDYKVKVNNKLKQKLMQKIPNQHDKQYKYLNENFFFGQLLIYAKSVSKLFQYFPELVQKLLIDIRNKINDRQQIQRRLCYGGYMQKISHQGQMKWVQTQYRPSDVLTLLRKFLLYKLTRRGGLFIRSFLSKQETYLFMVIKASQKHLQKKAQQSNFNMEVELGATDIFSFQPVDKYGRPLRCNKYIRDIGFVKKYNLINDKQDKDKDLGPKSVQSEALTLYKKAMKMNQDQLRAKIILDQQQCDQLYNWVKIKTGAHLIQPEQILNNSYNTQQIEENIWPIYYIFNKIIIEYLTKLVTQFNMQKGNRINIQKLHNEIGLTLRLMFLKALNFSNKMFRKHRNQHYKFIRNLCVRQHPLQTIWNQMGQDSPRGYYPYFYSQKNQRIWRKYQINEERYRSKFTPSDRLVITNNIIRQNLNISKSLLESMIIDFYPIHDPFILKHIKIRPFINVISKLIQNNTKMIVQEPQMISFDQNNTFVQYECDYTIQDFTKESMEQKLKFKCKNMTDFSVNSVAFYCGQKLAFFFQFRRFISERAWPLSIITFLVQILFWIQKTQITQTGSSVLTGLNNVLMVMMVIINIYWTGRTINKWQYHEKKLARSFGTNELENKVSQQKRVLFDGQMQRNLSSDYINDQQQRLLSKIIKLGLSYLVNLLFIVLMASIILLILVFKIQLYQIGATQSVVTNVPSILISIVTKILSYVHSKFIIGILINFENKKTIQDYQDSLSAKSFTITFIVTYFIIIIYGFFSQYLQAQNTCLIKTDTGQQVTNCYYFMSNQIVIDSITDLIITIAVAFYPYIYFYVKQYLSEKKQNNNISFNLNYFQSIDCFYQEQDNMESYMFTDEIDKTWQNYIQIMIAFTTLTLFAPIVPFLYIMMFLVGIISLNTKKRQIIYYSKRTLPIKVNNIGIWITILKIVSVLGIFVNVALVIYVREIITDSKSIVFFSCVFLILLIKYLFTFQVPEADYVGNRCKARIKQIITQKTSMNINIKDESINTDIQNLFYDQLKLKRTLPTLHEAKVRHK